jgi:hypothetical protein
MTIHLDLRPLQISATGPRFGALRELSDRRKAAALARNEPEVSKAAQPSPAPKAATPKPLSPEQIAKLAAERRRAADQEAKRKAEAEQRAAERRRVEIAASWQRARAAASGGAPVRKAAPANARADNHGWAKIHAALRASRTAK